MSLPLMTGSYFSKGVIDMHMKRKFYNIADLIIKITADDMNIFNNLNAFSTFRSAYFDLEIISKGVEYIEKPNGTILIDQEVKWVNRPDDIFKTSIYIWDETAENVICRADIVKDWSYAELYYLENNVMGQLGVSRFFTEIIFRNRILFNEGIVMHASAIAWEGKGIAFTAPSGTGKSTQARLWSKHLYSRILNDDRPAVRIRNNKAYVYGTPWSGVQKLYTKGSEPLSTIVLLEQAHENKIITLYPKEAVGKILPRCFLPYYDKETMNRCLEQLDNIFSNVSVYLLKCRPDREAVEVLYQCVK